MSVGNALTRTFIPSIKACRRPTALTHKWLGFYSLALLMSQLLLGVSYYTGPSVITEDTQSMKKNIVYLTNVDRTGAGDNPLVENPNLDLAAQAKLDDMFKNNYWDHISPSGKKPWDFIVSSNYRYLYAGENLAKGFVDSDSIVKAWMASPSHRENLLSSKYTEIGVAVGSGKIDGKPTTIAVQMFGAPEVVLASAKTPEEPIVLAAKQSNVEFEFTNAAFLSRLPYLAIWLIIFVLILFDGGMLRRCGLHRSKKHLFEFRSALLVNALVLLILCLNIVAIA